MRFAHSSRLLSAAVLAFGLLMGCNNSRAQDAGRAQTFSIQESYAKTEVYIPMRDGTRLFTIVYAPKDTGQKHPIIMTRTPYSVAPYGEGKLPTPRGTDLKFMQAGYIVVKQDVRGRFLSEGKFEDVRPEVAAEQGKGAVDESTDTYDTIDWLVKNVPNNNERVGIWGISYPGFYAAAGAHQHPSRPESRVARSARYPTGL